MVGDSAAERPDDNDPVVKGWRRERSAIIRDSLAVGVATGTYGITFGAVSVGSGLTVAQTCALSLFMFTGASQFAMAGVLVAGGSPISSGLTATLLGVRNAFYGLRLASLLQFRGWRRLVAAHLVIDESTAMSITRPSTAAARVGFLTTGLSVFALWNLATLAGALAGATLGDPRTYGLDAAVGAAFIALLWPRLQDRSVLAMALAAGVLALLLIPVAPPGLPVLAAAGLAILVGIRRPPVTLPEARS